MGQAHRKRNHSFPPDAFYRALTGALAAVLAALLLAQLFWVPFHLAWAWLLLPLALLNNTLWALLHEAIHGHLPAWAGRLLAILFGAPLGVLRAGHLTHHQLNRTEDLPDRVSAPVYYANLLGGLYLSEVVAAWLPARVFPRDEFGRRVFAEMARRRGEIRVDALLILAVHALAFFCYGADWPLLALALLARAVAISWLDYIYHYDTPTGDVRHARDLRLSFPLNWALLHFNLHHVHHLHPAEPWYRLPARHAGDFAGSYLRAALRVLRGPAPF